MRSMASRILLAQFLRRGDADVAKHGSGELGEEALDEVEPGAVLGREYEGEASFGSLGEPSPGFLGFVGGVIVENDLDRGLRRVGGVEALRDPPRTRGSDVFSRRWRGRRRSPDRCRPAGSAFPFGRTHDRARRSDGAWERAAGRATCSRAPGCPASRHRR